MMPFIVLISGLSNLVLGLLVYFKTPRKKVGRLFLLFTLCAAVWIFDNFLWLVTKDMIWLRLSYSAGVVFSISALFWVHALVETKMHFYYYAFYIIGIALFIASPIDGLIIQDVEEIFSSGFKTHGGPFFDVYSIFMVGALFSALRELFLGYRREKGVKRSQLRYVFLGGLLFASLVIFLDFIIPLLFNYFVLASLDAPVSLVLISLTSYATLRYRLMDAQIFLKQGFIYSIVGLLAYGMFYFIAWSALRIFGSFTTTPALIMVLFVSFIFTFFLPKVKAAAIFLANHYLYATIYDVQKTIHHLADSLTSMVNMRTLGSAVIATMQKTFSTHKVAFVVWQKERPYIQSEQFSKEEKIHLKKTSPQLDFVREIIIADEVDFYRQIQRFKKAYIRILEDFFLKTDSRMIIPLSAGHNTFGIIVLGSKQMDRIFTQDDITMLQTLTAQGAIAVHNALLYEDLRMKNTYLKRLLVMKDEFLDIMSHQLRTPISIIRGSTYLLIHNKAAIQKKDALRMIHDSALRLNDLVEDMLLAAEVDVIDFKVPFELLSLVNVRALVEKLLSTMLFQAQEKHISVSLDIPSDIVIYAYDKYVEVVLDNVISNSIKYTPANGKGSVVICAHKTNEQKVRIEVSDNGDGISPSDQERIFEKFVRTQKAQRDAPEGTGLGLFIVRKIMEAHPKGAYGVKSELGKGATFWVEFQKAPE